MGARGNLLWRSSWRCRAFTVPTVPGEGPEGPWAQEGLRLQTSVVLRGTLALCEVHGHMHFFTPESQLTARTREGLPQREQAWIDPHMCLRPPKCRGWRSCWRRGEPGSPPLWGKLARNSRMTTAASGVIGTSPHSRKHPCKPWQPGGAA